MPILTHKIRLYPNNKQETLFKKSCGVSRFAYNWALAEWSRQYKAGEKPSYYSLSKLLNSIKGTEYPWMYDVSKTVVQSAIENLGIAYKNTFDNIKKGKKKAGFPKFKKKGHRDSFKAVNGTSKQNPNAVKATKDKVKLPRIGWVKLAEPLRFQGRTISAVVSRSADKWFVSLSVETEQKLSKGTDQGSVGVDLGITTLATLSTGEEIVGPKAYSKRLKQLRRLSKSLSRKQKGSSNWVKAKTKLARLHFKIASIRKDSTHKLTNKLVTNYSLIGIEDLNISGMVKNRCLSRPIQDMGWGEFKRQLLYKAEMTGSKVVIVDRFFPSTKTCSSCGQLHEMPLDKRTLICDCGLIMKRDLNASINLRDKAVSSTVSACGEISSGFGGFTETKLASVKQESSSTFTKEVG